MFQQSYIPFCHKAAVAALLLKVCITDMNAITFPHNSTLNQKIPNTPLVISEIPDGNQILSALCMEDWCNKCLSSMAV